jgi:hypothetical protein
MMNDPVAPEPKDVQKTTLRVYCSAKPSSSVTVLVEGK